MNSLRTTVGSVCLCFIASAQLPEVRPQVAGRAVQEGQVTTVYLAPRFATAIRMPDAVNSVVVGDPDSFTAEHTEREPQTVFVKPITQKATQTNLIVSTVRGYQANLLLISRGEPAGTHPTVDFMMRYHPASRFVIDQSTPSASIAPTALLDAPKPTAERSGPAVTTAVSEVVPVSFLPGSDLRPRTNSARDEATADGTPELDRLLERQRTAPLPVLYGERPGIAAPGKQILKAGVSDVVDQGRDVIVLFSVVNVQDHAIELMPPQVQIGGKIKKGKIVRHAEWSNSEQLPVQEFRMSQRRIGPGDRADGVLVFRRLSFKQSNETLLLQMADSGAVDRPALAPIGFGISSLRQKGAE
jgi:hypothetical protein